MVQTGCGLMKGHQLFAIAYLKVVVAAGVCKACFSNEHMAKHSRMGEYREQFVKDLDPSSPGWPATLGDLSARLKTWRATLQSTVEDSMPPYLRLEDEARNLQVPAALSLSLILLIIRPIRIDGGHKAPHLFSGR